MRYGFLTTILLFDLEKVSRFSLLLLASISSEKGSWENAVFSDKMRPPTLFELYSEVYCTYCSSAFLSYFYLGISYLPYRCALLRDKYGKMQYHFPFLL